VRNSNPKGKHSKWHAWIGYGGEEHNLGAFNTKEEAAAAYDKEARRCFNNMRIKPEFSYRSLEEAGAAANKAASEYVPILPTPKSGFHGVNESGKRWQAGLRISDGRHQRLGTFATKEEAGAAHDKAARANPLKQGRRRFNYDSTEAAEAAAAGAATKYAANPVEPTRARPNSGYYGVSKCGERRWEAPTKYDNIRRSVGIFNTKEEVAAAYDKAARAHGGDKAVCNYSNLEAAAQQLAATGVGGSRGVESRKSEGLASCKGGRGGGGGVSMG
jgi:hypothetical protein